MKEQLTKIERIAFDAMYNDSSIIDMIDTIMKLFCFQCISYQYHDIREHDFIVSVQNMFDALHTQVYKKCLYHESFNELYEQYHIVFTYSNASDIAYIATTEILNDYFIDVINDSLIQRHISFFFERSHVYSDKIVSKKMYVITERYRRSIKATYNLDAYINQYIDFYSNI